MKSSILVARIMRVIETDGMIGDGVELAEAFATAVKSVNVRLESVQASVVSKQVSDAVRQMEEPPRLLDEINVLDFSRLPDWEALCERNGWQKVPPFDRTLLEKVLLLSESTETVEPFLRMYRKAVRTNNNTLAVRALRRLAEVDHSQNWESNLVQAEGVLQRQLLEEFASARMAGDTEAMDRIARDFIETQWRNTPQGKEVRGLYDYWDGKEARRREAEGAENLSLLRRCRDENWNRALAFSMIQAIDALVDNGWNIPVDDCNMVDECRRRVAEEMELEEKERRWKTCCEELHGAIQREDTKAIREALAAPDFFDREPPEELIRDAQQVIDHEEAAKRRKIMQISGCALLAIIAILGVSGWWLRQKLRSMRCDGEAARLELLAKGRNAIERIGETLRALKIDDPDVYADPRVNVWEGRLKSMISENMTRTNEIASLLSDLSKIQARLWIGSNGTVTGRLARVKSLLTADDTVFSSEYNSLKTSYDEHVVQMDEKLRNDGTTRHKELLGRIQGVTKRLTEVIGGNEQDSDVNSCKAEISGWKELYGNVLPRQEAELAEVEKSLLDAEKRQSNVRAAIEKLKNAQTAPEILEARKVLVDFYSRYPAIARLKLYPIDTTSVHEVMEGKSPVQRTFTSFIRPGIDATAFKSFLEESVISIEESPSFYSLYGLMAKEDKTGKLFALSKGRPDKKKPSYANLWQIDGDLLDFSACKMTSQMEKRASDIIFCNIPSTDEMRAVVSFAKQGDVTIGKFENEVLRLVGEHILAINDTKIKYIPQEKRFENHRVLVRGRYPAYRRVQMLDIYFRWLKEELKIMPPVPAVTGWEDRFKRLAQPISVDGIPSDMSWCCLWEESVRVRNGKCVKLLEEFASADWVKRYIAMRKARNALGEIAGWKIESAGQTLFDPCNPYQKKNPDTIIPHVPESIKVDHPLYALQNEDGRLRLKKALVPQNGRWARVAGGTLMPGEPLFQVVANGRPIDAEMEVANIVKSNDITTEVMKQFAAKIPFFDISSEKGH